MRHLLCYCLRIRRVIKLYVSSQLGNLVTMNKSQSRVLESLQSTHLIVDRSPMVGGDIDHLVVVLNQPAGLDLVLT